MAAALPNGMYSEDVIWQCDCAQCALSTDQRAYHMSFQTVCKDLADYRHAAHAMIYAIDDRILFNNYKMTADIMVGFKFHWLNYWHLVFLSKFCYENLIYQSLAYSCIINVSCMYNCQEAAHVNVNQVITGSRS